MGQHNATEHGGRHARRSRGRQGRAQHSLGSAATGPASLMTLHQPLLACPSIICVDGDLSLLHAPGVTLVGKACARGGSTWSSALQGLHARWSVRAAAGGGCVPPSPALLISTSTRCSSSAAHRLKFWIDCGDVMSSCANSTRCASPGGSSACSLASAARPRSSLRAVRTVRTPWRCAISRTISRPMPAGRGDATGMAATGGASAGAPRLLHASAAAPAAPASPPPTLVGACDHRGFGGHDGRLQLEGSNGGGAGGDTGGRQQRY